VVEQPRHALAADAHARGAQVAVNARRPVRPPRDLMAVADLCEQRGILRRAATGTSRDPRIVPLAETPRTRHKVAIAWAA
jgi:hypothetical protein